MELSCYLKVKLCASSWFLASAGVKSLGLYSYVGDAASTIGWLSTGGLSMMFDKDEKKNGAPKLTRFR